MELISSSLRRSELFSTRAMAFVNDQAMGSLAATRTFHRFICIQKLGSPVKGRAIEENFKRRRTLSSKFNQPFGKFAEPIKAIINIPIADPRKHWMRPEMPSKSYGESYLSITS